MKWVPFFYNGRETEWAELGPGRWGLVGHNAEVFHVARRGWGAMVDGQFIAYYATRNLAMRAVLDWIEYRHRLREFLAPRS